VSPMALQWADEGGRKPPFRSVCDIRAPRRRAGIISGTRVPKGSNEGTGRIRNAEWGVRNREAGSRNPETGKKRRTSNSQRPTLNIQRKDTGKAFWLVRPGGGDTMKNRVWGGKAGLWGEKRWADQRNRRRLRMSFASGRKRSAARWTKRFDRPAPAPSMGLPSTALGTGRASKADG
jgi:hypothetical protein